MDSCVELDVPVEFALRVVSRIPGIGVLGAGGRATSRMGSFGG